jgi:glycosyltransferase involved in cell wall biosynthesis
VVATSSGGIPEVIVHGETGYIAEIGDTERMAKYTIELLTNEKKHKRFADASRKRAVDEFETKLLLPDYERLYERVLAMPVEQQTIIPKNGVSNGAVYPSSYVI